MTDDEISVCPNCDAARIRRRIPGHANSFVDGQRRWYCFDCESRFDEPVYRDRRATSGFADDSAQAALLAADPNEVFSD